MNNEFVSVPRERLQTLLNRFETGFDCAHEEYWMGELRALLARPAAQRQGEPVAWVRVIAGEPAQYSWFGNKQLPVGKHQLYTHADPGEADKWRNEAHRFNLEVERLRSELVETQRISQEEELRANRYSHQLFERDALLREALPAVEYESGRGDAAGSRYLQLADKIKALSVSAEPSEPKCKGWTCFHCDEHFTDAESASIHFGIHEIQRPACLIDADEYRSMEARVREFANEDSELHRQMHRQANEHKLELRRAEESGYAKGIAEASAPVERDERAELILSDEQIIEAMRPDLNRADGGYVIDTAEGDVVKAGRALLARSAMERKPAELKQCAQGYGHGGHWRGPEYKCWLYPRSKEEIAEANKGRKP